MSGVVDVTGEVDSGVCHDLAQEGELGDASMLDLGVTKAVEALLGNTPGEHAKGIEESERRLGSELFLEGADGRGGFVHGGRGEGGGGADVGGDVFGVSPPDETQGYAGGSAEILLRSNIAVNAEFFANFQPQNPVNSRCELK